MKTEEARECVPRSRRRARGKDARPRSEGEPRELQVSTEQHWQLKPEKEGAGMRALAEEKRRRACGNVCANPLHLARPRTPFALPAKQSSEPAEKVDSGAVLLEEGNCVLDDAKAVSASGRRRASAIAHAYLARRRTPARRARRRHPETHASASGGIASARKITKFLALARKKDFRNASSR
jgi:hypothetical protein